MQCARCGRRTKTVSTVDYCAGRSDLQLVFSNRLRYQSAMTKDSVENLAKKLAESLPEGLRSMRDDLESNFLAALEKRA